MRARHLAKVATDPRLTPDAVRVILYLATAGPIGEEQDVKGEDLSIILHGGEKPIRAAIKRAEHCGYITNRFGGRAGHKLTLLPEKENDAPEGGNSEMAPPREVIEKGITPPGEAINENHSPGGGNHAPSSREKIDSSRPPPTPPGGILDEKAAAVIAETDALLAGCRGALTDYLEKRVSPENQCSYVRTVTTWLDGMTFPWGCAKLNGMPLPPDERPAYIADALNELATNEIGPGGKQEYKYTPGDPRNLKTKLQILLNPYTRKSYGNDRSSGGGAGGAEDSERQKVLNKFA